MRYQGGKSRISRQIAEIISITSPVNARGENFN